MITPQSINGAVLAYLGDSVLELLVRMAVVERNIKHVGEANTAARAFVTAEAQSAAVERIMPMLDEDELAAYKRGRNHSGGSVPRHASACEYRRATGFEAIFGYLHLMGKTERANELFHAAFPNELTPIESAADNASAEVNTAAM